MRKRQMYICRKCQGNCDAGELREGLCIDCIEKSRMKIVYKPDAFRDGSLKLLSHDHNYSE